MLFWTQKVGDHLQQLESKLISEIPLFLDEHFNEMKNSSDEIALFFNKHHDYLKTSLEWFFTNLITAIFYDDEQYEVQKKQTDLSSHEIGQGFIHQVKNDVDPEKLLDLNQHLYQKIFISVYTVIEKEGIENDQRIRLTDRLHELIWISSHGFLRGYLFSKNQEIDRLHQQKVSIMGQMAAGMAHEIRNPITSIKGFVHLLKEQNQQRQHDAETWSRYLSICEAEMKSIETLVSDYLLLAKNHQTESHFEVHNLNSIFRKIEALCYFYALDKNADFQCHIPEDSFVYTNSQYLEQVCLNVVKNAIDAVSAQGKVSLVCSHDPSSNEWVIRCIDNGCGIPPESLDTIFEPFFTTKQKGTGLGLSICNNLVDGLKGNLHITSEVDKGTTVEIRLPNLQIQLKN